MPSRTYTENVLKLYEAPICTETQFMLPHTIGQYTAKIKQKI